MNRTELETAMEKILANEAGLLADLTARIKTKMKRAGLSTKKPVADMVEAFYNSAPGVKFFIAHAYALGEDHADEFANGFIRGCNNYVRGKMN